MNYTLELTKEVCICGSNCEGCVTPTSDDPATVEYYGYASDPSWCDCVQEPAICESALVETTVGPQIGFHCVEGETPTETQILTLDNGCIYPGREGCPPFENPCDEGCTMPGNFIASKIFVNPYSSTADVHITGTIDDDAILTYNDTSFWLRSGLPDRGACDAGSVDYSFTIGPDETFKIEAYDTVGFCGGVDISVSFTLPTEP